MTKRIWIAALAAALVPLAGRAEADKKTERTWKAKCASCHGADGKGQTDLGQKMAIADYTDAAWQSALLQPGQTIAARGVSTTTLLGTVMEVEAIGGSPDQLVEVGPPPGGPGRGPGPRPGARGPPPPPR